MECCNNTIAFPSLRNKTEEEIRHIVAKSGADAIIHTAAILSDIGVCQAHPEASYIANVLIPVYLARSAKENNIKLICFSSDQVYTDLDDDGPYSVR